MLSLILALTLQAAAADASGSPHAPPCGPARRARSLALAGEPGGPSAMLAARLRVGGLPTVDALPIQARTPPPRLDAPLLVAWPGLTALPEPLEALVTRYPCPPPPRRWLVGSLALAGAGLGGMVAGEVFENRMMATDGEQPARRLYHLGLTSSFTGLAFTLGGVGGVAWASVQACGTDGGEP